MKKLAFGLMLLLALRAQAAERVTLEELVAPIALYPDVLVGQILAASTHPDEIVHVALWLEGRGDADTEPLAQVVDGKPWDPDLKALALVRPVLDALRRNFVWTTVLGEAYAARPVEVLRAVQSLRREALAAGELSSTPEQRVITTGGTILIEPVDLERVHVPGGPAFDVTVFYRFPWGWLSWDVDWGAGAVRYHDLPYVAGLRP